MLSGRLIMVAARQAGIRELLMAETTTETSNRKPRRTLTGTVSSAQKTPQTITVKADYKVRHPKYGKYVRRTMKVRAHDPKGEAREGDSVELMECRPISKSKTWRLVRVVESVASE